MASKTDMAPADPRAAAEIAQLVKVSRKVSGTCAHPLVGPHRTGDYDPYCGNFRDVRDHARVYSVLGSKWLMADVYESLSWVRENAQEYVRGFAAVARLNVYVAPSKIRSALVIITVAGTEVDGIIARLLPKPPAGDVVWTDVPDASVPRCHHMGAEDSEVTR
ncbi:hypothetical protein MF406_10760 [Georgenia sp. TF02-10]|uniref:hypothetical protein n=1 Tax=Georgenia sp. TF02-10 TaxID=2917725 RepID=UPI001FA6C80C|nr:hypothetical protein [Georgenia sp. TF02-10]UNX53478.1 hypothetical protein MF406_10760 [Georgenia sp. TF02-10]